MKKHILTLAIIVQSVLPSVTAARLHVSQELVSVTSYNSEGRQTDSSPNITATGTRTRYGIIAGSRDLVAKYGYGSVFTIVKWNPAPGCNASVLPTNLKFKLEDTMARRWTNKIDIWLPSSSQSFSFGKCTAIVSVLR
jgi:3D (Asp-Asp-Asp) domain-containing protein